LELFRVAIMPYTNGFPGLIDIINGEAEVENEAMSD
jgi:hypothetical protein